MPRLVYALENDYEGPMCLNDDNTLGVTNFTYSAPYTINGFDYVDEFFKALDGITYARVLFINELEAAQELTSQRHYYKFAEVVPYPQGIPGLVVTAVHDNAAFNPWILQNWLIAQEIQDNINQAQWHSIQIFMQQEYQTEPAAEVAYTKGIEAAKVKRALQKTKRKLNKLKIQNQEMKAKLKLAEEQQQKALEAAAKKAPPPAAPKLSKAQKQKIRRDDILYRTSRISALATMATQTINTILSLLKDFQLNEADRAFFTENLHISIHACSTLLKILHNKDYISLAVKQAFLYKFASFPDAVLLEYAKDHSTQQFVTMTFELTTDLALHKKIKTWHLGVQTVKLNKTKLIAELNEDIKQKEKSEADIIKQKEELKAAIPESQLQQAILDLNDNEFIETLKKYPELNKKVTGIFKKLLPALSTSESNKVKQFLDMIKLSKDLWLDIYIDPNTKGAVKSVADKWADSEATAIFESISRKTKPVKISPKALALFHKKTNSDCKTLLKLVIEKSYPDDMIEQIFMHTSPSELLSMDIDDQTLLHYLGSYKGDNYELIKRMRDAFIKAVDDAKQHAYEMVHMKSDKDGGTFLHFILRGENEEQACKMMRLFFNDNTLPPKWQDTFRSVIFDKNQSNETAAAILDLKDSEWEAARRLLYALIPDLIFDYEFPHGYGYFFLAEAPCTKLIDLVFSDPHRVMDILNSRTNLQITVIDKIAAILKKTPKELVAAEEERLHKVLAYLNFEMSEATLVPGTEMNIHRMLAQKICTEYDKNLEKKYNDSIFYKTYNNLALSDTLLWSKFTHAFRVWEVSRSENPNSSQYKNLDSASIAFVTYLMKNHGEIHSAIKCFFDLNESPRTFSWMMKLITRLNTLESLAYRELFKFVKHHKFGVLFNRISKDFDGPELAIFVRHVVQFVSQNPDEFGLLLSVLTHNNSNDVTKEFLANVNKYFINYDTFLIIALDQNQTFLICNLLCGRDAETGRSTMHALCRIAIIHEDFEILYKILEMAKGAPEHSNWDPQADFLYLLFKTAAVSKNLQMVETLITRFKPTITAGIILAIADSEVNKNEPTYLQMMRLVTDEREKQLTVAKEQTVVAKDNDKPQETQITKILKRKDKLVIH